MISCANCGKENQDHYKFCLGCGAELPKDSTSSRGSLVVQTPPHGIRAFGVSGAPSDSFPKDDAPGAIVPKAPPTGVTGQATSPPGGVQLSSSGMGSSAGTQPCPPCPQCGHPNASNNVFCGSCGFRLAGSAQPAPQRTAVSASPLVGETAALTALRADGSEAGVFPLTGAAVTVGREVGGIFSADTYLSPKHATFRQPSRGMLLIRDEGSLNGVYRKLAPNVPVVLQPGDVFRIGQEILRFENIVSQPPANDGVERLGAPSTGYIGRLSLVTGRDTMGNAFPVPDKGVYLGRERGDILFSDDGYVSGLHCRVAPANGGVTLTDLGSSNGSFLRLFGETELRAGDVLLMGQQLYKVSV